MSSFAESSLVLTFKVTGESQVLVKGAARIKVDGKGGMVFYDRSGTAKTFELERLQLLGIQAIVSVPNSSASRLLVR